MLTTGYDETSKLPAQIQDVLIDWLAAGLNPGVATLFIQSHVPEHAELHLLLSMITPLGWLERVPSYKDQQEQLKEKDLATYGFLGYPLLQSADILVYRAAYVPVGEDQVAHVELTREAARRFNHLYGREPDFEAKAERAVKSLGGRNATNYRQLRRAFQEAGDTEALQRLGVAGLLEGAAQLAVVGRVASPEALHGALRLRLEVGLASVEMIEAPRGLARQLDVRHLILAHRHVGGAIHQDVRALQQRVAEEAVGGEILLFQLFLLILVARHALEPAERSDHRQQQMQLRVLGHVRLDEERRDSGVEARGQPVDEHLADVLLKRRRLVVAGGEHVPVGDEEEAVVLVLQLDPVAQRAVVVAEVQPTGGPHAGEDAPRGRRLAHVPGRSSARSEEHT